MLIKWLKHDHNLATVPYGFCHIFNHWGATFFLKQPQNFTNIGKSIDPVWKHSEKSFLCTFICIKCYFWISHKLYIWQVVWKLIILSNVVLLRILNNFISVRNFRCHDKSQYVYGIWFQTRTLKDSLLKKYFLHFSLPFWANRVFFYKERERMA